MQYFKLFAIGAFRLSVCLYNYILQLRWKFRMYITCRNLLVCFFSLDLTINITKLDETGIRFPAVTFNSVSVGTEELTTFLELPKQSKGAKNGFYFLFFDISTNINSFISGKKILKLCKYEFSK